MSAEREGGEVVFCCDACSETLETGEDEFDRALTTLRREGWHCHRHAKTSEWMHFCPAHRGAEIERRTGR